MLSSVFLDTNIVLDLFGKRDPFYLDAARIATLADHGEIQLFTSPLSFATVHYFLTKFESSSISLNKLQKLRAICKISPVDESSIDKSLSSEFSDFEDGIQYYSALSASCDVIITRNGRDFKHAEIPVMSPLEFLNSLK